MGQAGDNLSVWRSTTERGALGRNVAITPSVANRDNLVLLDISVSFAAVVNGVVELMLEIRPAGSVGSWQRIHRTRYEQGTATLSLLGTHVLSVLGAGYPQLLGLVPAGHQYRWLTNSLATGTTVSAINIYETTIEVDAHKSVQWRLDGGDTATVPATDAFRLQCDWPCWAPSLAFTQYKRDPEEPFTDFDSSTNPQKAYVRGPANVPGGGSSSSPLDDASGNAHALTAPTGMAPPGPSPFAGFNGGRHVSGDRSLHAVGFNLNGLSAFTVECKIGPGHYAGTYQHCTVYGAAGQRQMALATINGISTFVMYDGTNAIAAVTAITPVNDGAAHDLRGVWDGAQIVILVDGMPEGAAPYTGPLPSVAADFVIGGVDAADAATGSHIIDEVRVSNIARDSAADYTPELGPVAADANTLALWHLDGQLADDEKLSLTSSPDLGVVGIGGDDAAGPFANAHSRRFTTEGNYYQLAANALLPDTGQSYWVAAWVKVDAFGQTSFRIAEKLGADDYFILYMTETSLAFRTYQALNAGVDEAAVGLTAVADGMWHWVVGFHDRSANVNRLYIDGAAVATVASNTENPAGDGEPIVIGRAMGPGWNVCLADVVLDVGGLQAVDRVPSSGPKQDLDGRHECHFPLDGGAPVSGGGGQPIIYNALQVIGNKAEESTSSFSLIWRGQTFTDADTALMFPTPTTWAFSFDAAEETPSPGELMTIRQNGQPDQFALICIVRSVPTATFEFTGMAFGTDEAAPMRRGEYARVVLGFAATDLEIESAVLSYGNGEHWIDPPTDILQSGTVTQYFRSSALAPCPGISRIFYTVSDKAGNTNVQTLTAYFDALPAGPQVQLENLAGAERPAHLADQAYAETDYDDRMVGGEVVLAVPLAACRNSGIDNTAARLVSGGLAIMPVQLVGIAGSLGAVLESSAVAQPSVLGVGFKAEAEDQYFQTAQSAEYGNYAFNANRAVDFSDDQFLATPFAPYSGKAVHALTDETDSQLIQARILGGQLDWLASGGQADLWMQLLDNADQVFQLRLFAPDGAELAHNTAGSELKSELWTGSAWVEGAGGVYDAPALHRASRLLWRITALSSMAPAIVAVAVNYRAARLGERVLQLDDAGLVTEIII